MTLTQVHESDDSNKEKVGAIAKIVENARIAYGNNDATITEPEIRTIDGLQDLRLLSDESKVALAEAEVNSIKLQASEFLKSNEGAVLENKVVELIALSPLLANITVTVDSEFL